MPGLHRLNRGATAKRGLRKLRVVERNAAHDGLLQILATHETVGFQNGGDTSVKPLEHTIGLLTSWLSQARFNFECVA